MVNRVLTRTYVTLREIKCKQTGPIKVLPDDLCNIDYEIGRNCNRESFGYGKE